MHEYKLACYDHHVRTGKMFATETGDAFGPAWIINFPTKQDWRDPSLLRWIKYGLVDLKLCIINNNIKSIAIPALGVGCGGLPWKEVQACINFQLYDLEDVNIQVYLPR